jgi:hypothetical protein
LTKNSNNNNKSIIVLIKGTVRFRTGHEDPEGEWIYSFTIPLTSALDVGGWSTPRLGSFTLGKDSIPIVQEAGWTPESVWTGAENLAPVGFDPLTVQRVAQLILTIIIFPRTMYGVRY